MQASKLNRGLFGFAVSSDFIALYFYLECALGKLQT